LGAKKDVRLLEPPSGALPGGRISIHLKPPSVAHLLEEEHKGKIKMRTLFTFHPAMPLAGPAIVSRINEAKEGVPKKKRAPKMG
jgi:hypothetical protein